MHLVRTESVTGSTLEYTLKVAWLVELFVVALDVLEIGLRYVADVLQGLLHQGIAVVLRFDVFRVVVEWRGLHWEARNLLFQGVALVEALQLGLHVVDERLYVLLGDLRDQRPLLGWAVIIVVVLLGVDHVLLDEGQLHEFISIKLKL